MNVDSGVDDEQDSWDKLYLYIAVGGVAVLILVATMLVFIVALDGKKRRGM